MLYSLQFIDSECVVEHGFRGRVSVFAIRLSSLRACACVCWCSFIEQNPFSCRRAHDTFSFCSGQSVFFHVFSNDFLTLQAAHSISSECYVCKVAVLSALVESPCRVVEQTSAAAAAATAQQKHDNSLAIRVACHRPHTKSSDFPETARKLCTYALMA